MRIAVGSDHAGYEYKQMILEHLKQAGHDAVDFGTHSNEPVDYPDFIVPVARAVAAGEYDRGIVLGGSGNGEAMAANKVRGIRCALCWNAESAQLSRRHNDANLLSLGQRMLSANDALAIVDHWLKTPFDGGRHEARIRKLNAIEP
jgi:ribose 5-phosphate isomerase B